jgi:beta-galactosidase GanA
MAVPGRAAAQGNANPLEAIKPGLPLKSGHLRMGTGAGPGGRIGITNLYLTRDDRPWLPVMGEFHFTRFPSAFWEEELLKMKAAGVTIVASYILWNHVELVPGRIDWSGDRDIRRFVELCGRHGLLFFLRPGPWGHAEARFGGIPDWIVAGTRPRGNDPAYLAEVERFWRSLYGEVKGLLWKDGGPIVGMQVENEYNLDGPEQGAYRGVEGAGAAHRL